MAPMVMAGCLLGAAAAQDLVNVHNPDAPHVQLPSFMAPTQTANGGWATAPMTLLLEIRVTEDVRNVCRLLPRVQDAVMQDLFAHPVPQAPNGHMTLAGVGERLAIAVNGALAPTTIVDVHVFEGVLANGPGGVKFTQRQTCRSSSR